MKIISFHVEASSYCNARCPGCPRNIYGFNVKDYFPQTHLSLDRYKDIRTSYSDITFVNFNGNLGDPMMHPKIDKLIEISDSETQVTTNGSIGSREMFERLSLLGTTIIFSVDGLEDTNHLYRQDVEWNKVIDRMKWFINKGGRAIWKWVPFKHNIHQLEEARTLSKQMGFINFTTDNQGRNDFPALDKEGNISHWIQPHDGPGREQVFDPKAAIELLKRKTKFLPETGKRFDISCEHLKGDIYVSSKGEVAPCCYHGITVGDRELVKLEEFESLKSTWVTENCDPTCANNCGRLL